MHHPRVAVGLARAAHRTWGSGGLRRRIAYELGRRVGAPARSEQAWIATLRRSNPGLGAHRPIVPPPALAGPLTCALAPDGAPSTGWHVHPLTGRRFPMEHWTSLRQDDSAAGDIKDLWEPGRLSWLLPRMRAAAADPHPALAEQVWRQVEEFVESNPPYLGPQWMCGQESALRGISVAAVASGLRDSPASTASRRAMASHLLAVTVGRVRPTVGYALSQRNNHAISEASFLWSAAVMLDDLPDAAAIRGEGAAALTEAVRDQWYADGSYAQHSPVYQRLALHGLLWTLAVARSTGVAPPDGVRDVVRSSVGFLSSLMETGTGCLPNLGGNDGALLFDLSGSHVADFRPVISHAAAASGIGSGLPAGTWDEEARWFGLEPQEQARPARPDVAGLHHHVHRGPRSCAVLRAGSTRHRPAHADQLHVDVWIGPTNVAMDAGSYRYTAPDPWQNALADEAVHNVPRVPGHAQALRRGRFLWARWSDAMVIATHRADDVDATLVALELPQAASLRRLLVRIGDLHVVLDESDDLRAIVRWNLPAGARLDLRGAATTADGEGWHAAFAHGGSAHHLCPDEGDPTSGWVSPSYGVKERCTALELRVDDEGRSVAAFAPAGTSLVHGLTHAPVAARDGHELRRLLWA